MSKRAIPTSIWTVGLLVVIGVGAFFIPRDTETSIPIQEPVQNTNGDVEDRQTPIVKQVQNTNSDKPIEDGAITWFFDGGSKTWKTNGNPPACPDSLVFPAPADVSLASGILYPGQIRGGDYKPHGGIRFDSLSNNNISVYAPMDGKLFKASRHMAFGEVQYSLYVTHDCGIMYKLDHLRVLTKKFEDILNSTPMGAEGDSRTTQISPPVFIAKGELIATKVGFESNKNVFFDFGVYDLRKTNGVIYDANFRAQHSNIDEAGTHALCWLDYLIASDRSIVKGLPGSGTEGKTSDYCK